MKTSSTLVDSRCFKFGPYVVDARRRLLWRDGAHVPLTPRALEILDLLIQRRNQVVTKEELLEELWPDTAVEENTLTRHISTLRKALDERPAEHQYIVTVPGHGYQFVAAVRELDECPAELRHTVGLPPRELEPRVPLAQTEVAPRVEEPVPHVRPRASRSAIVVTATLAIAVAALGGVLIVALRGVPRTATHRTLRQITFESGLQREPAWSPDGKAIAYSSTRSGNADIWIQSIGDVNPRRLTTAPEDDSQPDWSPDGQWIVFRSERDGGGLFVVSSRGDGGRRIASFGYQPSWSPDGSLVLFSSSGHVGGTPKMYAVGIDGGSPQQIRPDLTAGLRALQMAWKPGTRDVSIWGRTAAGKWTFMTAPLSSGPAVVSEMSGVVSGQIAAAGLSLGRFRWSQSGRHLFFEGRSQQVRNLWRVTVDPVTLAWIDGPERLTTGSSDDADLAVSADGSLVFSARHARTRLWVFPFDAVSGQVTGPGKAVTSGGAGELDADTPDDGSKLVYRTIRGDRQEIWQRSLADGTDRVLISSVGWNLTRPRWSPDGSTIAYARTRQGSDAGSAPRRGVVILSAAGGEERLITSPSDLGMVPMDWSADGQWLVGGCRASSAATVSTCTMPASARSGYADVRVLTADPQKNMFEQRFSPDQRWIAFIAVDAADAAVSTIYVVPAGGGRWTAMTEGLAYDDKPHWGPDGRTLYFVSNRQGSFNVWGRRFDGATGAPAGGAFRVTSFSNAEQGISSELGRMQIAVTSKLLFLPITETSGELWTLANVDR